MREQFFYFCFQLMLLRKSAQTSETFSFLNFFGHCGLFLQDFEQGRASLTTDLQEMVGFFFVLDQLLFYVSMM